VVIDALVPADAVLFAIPTKIAFEIVDELDTGLGEIAIEFETVDPAVVINGTHKGAVLTIIN